jgi:hypothetical protein
MNTLNYRNIADINTLILKRLSLLPRNYDLIIGIPESGLIPANLLSLYLNRPFTDLFSFLNGHIYKAGERGSFFASNEYRKVLVVDDVLRSGNTLREVREKLASMSDRFEFSYCAIYCFPGKETEVDYFFEHLGAPSFLQWHLVRDGIREKVHFNKQETPVYSEMESYPFLFAPNTLQAAAAFKKTGKAVLSLSDFELIDSTNTMWTDLKKGKYMPGIRHFAIQFRNQIRKIRKKNTP